MDKGSISYSITDLCTHTPSLKINYDELTKIMTISQRDMVSLSHRLLPLRIFCRMILCLCLGSDLSIRSFFSTLICTV